MWMMKKLHPSELEKASYVLQTVDSLHGQQVLPRGAGGCSFAVMLVSNNLSAERMCCGMCTGGRILPVAITCRTWFRVWRIDLLQVLLRQRLFLCQLRLK